MQEHDARILRGAAIPTAIAGAIAAGAALVTAGLHGLLGAACAAVLVLAFFTVSAYVVNRAAAISSRLLFAAGLGTYAAKVLALGALLVVFGGSTAFDGGAFALTSVVCVVVWLGAHMRVLSTDERLYVEPVDSTGDRP